MRHQLEFTLFELRQLLWEMRQSADALVLLLGEPPPNNDRVPYGYAEACESRHLAELAEQAYHLFQRESCFLENLGPFVLAILRHELFGISVYSRLTFLKVRQRRGRAACFYAGQVQILILLLYDRVDKLLDMIVKKQIPVPAASSTGPFPFAPDLPSWAFNAAMMELYIGVPNGVLQETEDDVGNNGAPHHQPHRSAMPADV